MDRVLIASIVKVLKNAKYKLAEIAALGLTRTEYDITVAHLCRVTESDLHAVFGFTVDVLLWRDGKNSFLYPVAQDLTYRGQHLNAVLTQVIVHANIPAEEDPL